PHIFVAGADADDIGVQSGGWTIEWQGQSGNITTGTTIRKAIQNAVGSNDNVTFDRFCNFKKAVDAAGNPLHAEVGIVVFGEQPDAEGLGDKSDLSLSASDVDLIYRVRDRVDKLVVILLSGRPVILDDIVDEADAVVAAWLPGTEGEGVSDVLFGDKPFTG